MSWEGLPKLPAAAEATAEATAEEEAVAAAAALPPTARYAGYAAELAAAAATAVRRSEVVAVADAFTGLARPSPQQQRRTSCRLLWPSPPWEGWGGWAAGWL